MIHEFQNLHSKVCDTFRSYLSTIFIFKNTINGNGNINLTHDSEILDRLSRPLIQFRRLNPGSQFLTRWRHFMEMLSALLALYEGIPPGFPSQRPVTWSFDVFFGLRLNRGLASNQDAYDLRRRRAQYDVTVMHRLLDCLYHLWNHKNIDDIKLLFFTIHFNFISMCLFPDNMIGRTLIKADPLVRIARTSVVTICVVSDDRKLPRNQLVK